MAMMKQNRDVDAEMIWHDEKRGHLPELILDCQTCMLQIARTLRDHTPSGEIYWCRGCTEDWPCPEWQRASDHIGSPTDQPDDASHRQT